MTTRKTKVPPPYTATQTDPGGRGATDATWVQKDQRFKESQPQPDYRTGNGSGINSE